MQIKHIIFCFLFFVIGINTHEETLTWNESRRLTWDDFRADADSNSDAVALTASGITFGYSVKTSGDRIIGFSASVEAHFYPNKSWYIVDKENTYILGHEQLHFDITELYARKFRKQLERLVVNQNVKEQMNRLHVAINEALGETQIRYDTQSNHSINVEMQKQWEAFIKEELKKLDEYKSK
ncbi:DUF922 domain-containing protein [Winogradskyella sp. PG-2]|uniref:DUF922 domain-containing protein n=1 Tax=Winogradskyella sp. PG-2 TaxID=754409 RepID=UPI0004586603|nr:DUF922 domain-containing protein [Winogradskyella sp. PG-2]BAO76772.1 hypothetical protein WPG_2542 [Winogradskyella sp. PG-2]